MIARLLGAGSSGQLYYTLNNFSFVSLLVSLSLESGMAYFLARNEIREKELVGISLIWSIGAAALAALIVNLFSDSGFDTTKYNSPLYCFLFIGGTLLTTYFSALFLGRQEFLYPHLIPAITNFFFLLYGLTFIAGQEVNSAALVTVYFFSFLLNGLILCILYHSRYSLHFAPLLPSKNTLIKLGRYSLLALATNILAFLALRVDYWILKAFSPSIVTDKALGNYIQVTKLVQIFLFAPTIISAVIFPQAAINPAINPAFKKMTLQILAMNVGISGILLVIGKWLFPALYGNDFSMMYLCFAFSIPAILSMTLVRVMSSYFAGINKVKYNFLGSLIALVIIVVFNLLLIPGMGINGAAIADSAGYFAYMITLLFFFKRNNRI